MTTKQDEFLVQDEPINEDGIKEWWVIKSDGEFVASCEEERYANRIAATMNCVERVKEIAFTATLHSNSIKYMNAVDEINKILEAIG